MPLQEGADDNHFNNITLPSIQEEVPSSPEKRGRPPTQSPDSMIYINVNALEPEGAGEGESPPKQISVAGIAAEAVSIGNDGSSSPSVESRTYSSRKSLRNRPQEAMMKIV